MKIENEFVGSVAASVKPDQSTSHAPGIQTTAFQHKLEEAVSGNKSDVKVYSEEEVKAMRSASHEDLDFIRKHGFQAYSEKLREEKIEEMRAEILATMGFTEDDLNQMPAEQRNAIEEAISEKIKQRIAAQSELNNLEEAKKGPKNTEAQISSQLGGAAKINVTGDLITSSQFGLDIFTLLNEQQQELDSLITTKKNLPSKEE